MNDYKQRDIETQAKIYLASRDTLEDFIQIPETGKGRLEALTHLAKKDFEKLVFIAGSKEAALAVLASLKASVQTPAPLVTMNISHEEATVTARSAEGIPFPLSVELVKAAKAAMEAVLRDNAVAQKPVG